MKLEGEEILSATPAEIWARLLDAGVLQRCVPGCESVTPAGELQFDAVAVIKVGPVKARFSGRIDILDPVEPVSCRLSGEGSGGVAGFARGEALIRLEPGDGVTVLRYEADIRIGGKISSLGDRLFRSVVEKNVQSFFATLKAELAP